MENIKKLKNIKMVNNILIAFLTIIPLLGIQLYKNGLDLYIVSFLMIVGCLFISSIIKRNKKDAFNICKSIINE